MMATDRRGIDANGSLEEPELSARQDKVPSLAQTAMNPTVMWGCKTFLRPPERMNPGDLLSLHVLTNDSALVPSLNIAERDGLTARRPTLPALTGIRFFAAMSVVFYHSRMPEVLESHGLMFLGHIFRNGFMAVPLFFILSGIILSYTYEGQVETRTGKRRFWEARFARVWPLYLVSLLLSSLVNQSTPAFSRVVEVLFMVQAWDPVHLEAASAWNFVCWTLSAEALFYLIFPFLQVLLERLSSTFLLVFLLLVLTVAVGFNTSHINLYGSHRVPLAVVHVPEFLVGVCCGNLRLRSNVSRRTILPISAFWTWLAAGGTVVLLSFLNPALTSWAVCSIAALLFGLGTEASALQRLLSTSTLQFGGQISYGIYLLQWPCKTAVNAACDSFQIESVNLRFGLGCAVLILLSTATFYGVEEPVRRVVRAGFAKLENVSSNRRDSGAAHS